MVPEWLLGFVIGPQIIMGIAKEHRVDPHLVLAMVQVESSGGRRLTRYEPHVKDLVTPGDWAHSLGISHVTEITHQKTSWGPMHILGSTARDEGFEGEIPLLIYPETGLHWGCKFLRKQFIRYDDNMVDAVAAYNGGSARYQSNGMLDPKLRRYVDKVMGYYREIKKDIP